MTKIPIAVITNGALLSTGQVRDELTGADIVMPSLDAADEEVFRHVNRPCPRLHIDEIIEGLSMFSRIFEGQLWVEVMLCKGLNDDQASLQSLRDGLDQIAPDRVQINVPVRPPAEAWVEIPDHEAIVRATSLLGDVAEVVSPYDGSFSLEGSDSPMDAVLAIIRRHPIREVRLLETLERYSDKEVEDVLLDLEQSGRARQRVHYGEVFWESTQVRAEE
jgi:wyosine [tRNA(Phe)-imidazoG37] synthetase (radical SAM superfamily)